MNIKCISCKGSNPIQNCGRVFCPIIAKSESSFRVEKIIKNKDFTSVSPAPFVGRFGYPNVDIGILSPPEEKENAWEYDAPRFWAGQNYDIHKIIDFRSELINSNMQVNVRNRDKIMDITQQIALSVKPVDIEINLEDKPKFKLITDSYLAPLGPNAKLKKARVTSNPKTGLHAEKVFSDIDFKATDAVNYLFEHNIDENNIAKMLSVGTLGVKKDRRLVPTRWSITATDDIIGKKIIEEIKEYESAGYEIYFDSYLGNYYLILFFPDVWGYELFESYMPNASWNQTGEMQFSTDHESFHGRKNYAENCAGGYYTARLAIAEHLKEIRKQASSLAIRIITGEYAAPLGVWVTREASRKAMKNKIMSFNSKELMISYAKDLLLKKFGFNLDSVLRSSIIYKEIRSQRKLGEYF